MPHKILPNNRAVYKTMWKNMVQPYMSHMTTYGCVVNMRFACGITKAGIQTQTYNM